MLFNCPECRNKISSETEMCLYCGIKKPYDKKRCKIGGRLLRRMDRKRKIISKNLKERREEREEKEEHRKLIEEREQRRKFVEDARSKEPNYIPLSQSDILLIWLVIIGTCFTLWGFYRMSS